MKKFYKDFEKVYIGTSDIASLTVRSVFDVHNLSFGEDGAYSAYECFGDVEIGGNYSKVFSGKSWIKIYDDSELVYNKHFDEFPFFDIYRAGNFGCIIHWHGEETEKETEKGNDNKGDNISVVCSDGDMTIDNSPNARYIISRDYYENEWFNCYKEDFINELANEENHSITAEAVANWCKYCHTFHDDSAFVYDSEELEICATLDEAREKVKTIYKPETSIYICENSDEVQFEVTSVSIIAFEPIDPSEKLEASPEIWKKIDYEAFEEYWSGFEFSSEKWQALTEKINQKAQALNTK